MRFSALLFLIVAGQYMNYVKDMDAFYDNLTPDIVRALLHIAANIENSIGFRAAAFFLHRGIVNRWEYRFLLGTDDEAQSELTERQLCCRRRINRQILHSFTAIELNAALGIDVREIMVARNGWCWNAEAKRV
jgi:hypothetical protein